MANGNEIVFPAGVQADETKNGSAVPLEKEADVPSGEVPIIAGHNDAGW